MPTYQIFLYAVDGLPPTQLETHCTDDIRAKVLAHAVKRPADRRIEVWKDHELIYARPWQPTHQTRTFATSVRR